VAFQLPVRSPLPLGAIVAGVPGLWADGRGPAERLERTLRDRFAARAALLLDGGTSALAVALRGAAAEAGGRPAALPAYGCFDIATAALGAGVRALLYDTDPATLGPEPASFGRALGADPSAIVLAHLYGVPVDLPRFAGMASRERTVVIEDAAQGSGAWLGERRLGSFGDLSVLSFGRGKGVTGGGGGALLAFTDRGVSILEAARAGLSDGGAGLRELVMLKAQWLLGRPGVYRLPASLPFLKLGETVYRAPHPARGIARTSVRVLGRTWGLADAEAGVRRRNAERLLRGAGPALRPIAAPRDARPGWLRLPVLLGPRARGSRVFAEARALGIVPGYPIALSELAELRGAWVNRDERLDGARRLAAELVTLPTHGGLGESDLVRIERWMSRVNGAPA